MHALLSNLTAVLLVIHAMIGCCHHHWHEEAECATTAQIGAAPCQCCYHHGGSNNEGEPSSEPCSGDVECQGVCTYLPTPRSAFDVSNDEVALDFATAIPTFIEGQLADTLPWDCVHTFNDSLPIKLHLWHQVLLI